MSDSDNVIASARQEPGAHPYTILVVDDEPAILESVELTLGDDYRVLSALSARAGIEVLEREEVSLVIADQVMPGVSGAEFLERAVEIQPRAVRIMLTGYADVNAIIRAINDGKIYRYIQKPWEPDQLRLDVRRALEAYQLTAQNAQLASALAIANEKLRAENLFLRRQAQRSFAFDQMIGASPAMQRVFDVMQKVAQTDATVLVTGETGTGKDLVARAIHYAGARKDRRFVAQNCGALPDTLLESELFGHKRGAFTGAHIDKKGLFEVADGGTIFLDEIGETEPGMQVRLLRVLQDGEIRPLGSSETKRVDVRIIAATNRDPKKLVESGRFREDLLYRLRVVEIRLPALRERREDIPALAHFFLDRANAKMRRSLAGFTNSAMDRLCAHLWYGNVRELENEIQRAVALAGDEKTIHEEMLSEHVRGPTPAQGARGIVLPAETDMNRAVEALKAAMIQEALKTAGNVTRAADKLGIPRQSLQKMMKRLGLREAPADE
ncbi:MAG TPA: sigma-54 dependent transcriptional regulator [Myxococcota bacterium]|jgi:two-component system response regulator HupR/HoxA